MAKATKTAANKSQSSVNVMERGKVTRAIPLSPTAAAIEAAKAVLAKKREADIASGAVRVRSTWGNTLVRLKGKPEEEANLPRQAKAILAVLDSAKGKKMTMAELLVALDKGKNKPGGLETRQDSKRIVVFYRDRLNKAGAVKFE